MVVRRHDGHIAHTLFRDLPRFVDVDDLLVLNDSRVFPARLFATREGKPGLIEVLLLREVGDRIWEALVRPGKHARPGTRLVFEPGFEAEAVETPPDGQMTRRLRFHFTGEFHEKLDRLGRMPLPPYITRLPREEESREDRERYQTVFATAAGSVAAPTAGLHFTSSLLKSLRYVTLTLHVGYGTFQPVKAERVTEHRMHAEFFHLSREAAAEIRSQTTRGKRVITVGTTTTRVLEHLHREKGEVVPGEGWTSIFIYPGFDFRVIGGLITNFHLPKSTLLLLVSAFAGKDLIAHCYSEAIRERYRFYSYGDAMLIL
jgi:S-adenosylmethionine:tRNA ribosyltransferase-isomerase